MKIKTKLLTMFIILLIIPGAVISVFGYFNSNSGLNDLTEKGLRNSVYLASELIEAQNNLVEAGVLTMEEAQEEVKKQLIGDKSGEETRTMDVPFEFGENGYFVVFDAEGNTIGHPTIEGENVWDEQFNGTYFIQEMIKEAEAGGGFTYYDFPMPGDPDTVRKKITFTQEAPHWDWIIGVNAYVHEYNDHTNSLIISSIITLALTVIVGFLLGNFFANSLSNPIRTITNHAEHIASGDLQQHNIQVKSTDELGALASSINKMTENLREVIREVSTVSNEINTHSDELGHVSVGVMEGSEQIVATMEELSSTTEKEAEHANELSHTMKEFSSNIEEANENGTFIQHSSEEVLKLTTNGYDLMEKSNAQMNVINKIVSDAVTKINELDDRSQQISQLVAVIQEVAEQTNLLALNAAIEAARAGEQGQGFAVVAEEVRKLAEEVSSSVTDITEIVSGVQGQTRTVTESLQTGYEEVEQGTIQIEETENTFRNISSAVENMVHNIQNITSNLQNIAGEGQDMSRSVQEIAAISEQTAAGIEETTAAAEESSASIAEVNRSSKELITISEQLNKLVAQFRL